MTDHQPIPTTIHDMKVRRDHIRSQRSATFVPPFRQKPPVAPPVTITVTIPAAHAPALRSAIDEISTIIGTRLEGPHAYDKEEALTHAAASVGALRAAVNAVVPMGAKHYA